MNRLVVTLLLFWIVLSPSTAQSGEYIIRLEESTNNSCDVSVLTSNIQIKATDTTSHFFLKNINLDITYEGSIHHPFLLSGQPFDGVVSSSNGYAIYSTPQLFTNSTPIAANYTINELTFEFSLIVGNPYPISADKWTTIGSLAFLKYDASDWCVKASCNKVKTIITESYGSQTDTATLEKFDFTPYCSDCLIVLPIELSSFTVRETEDCQALIEWTTEIEINNAYFEILKSQDGHHFESFKRIEGKGLTWQREPQDYKLFDPNPFPNTYYQLKQVDLNGDYEFFDIKHLSTPCVKNKMLNIYPNPVHSYQQHVTLVYNWDGNSNAKKQLVIKNMVGKIVSNQTINLNAGYNNIVIDTYQLNTGVYYLHFENTQIPAFKLLKVQ